MIWLTDETRQLIKELEISIDKDKMLTNWKDMIEIAPIHSGSVEEEKAMDFLKTRFEKYGLHTKLYRFDAYISDPKYASIKIIHPIEKEIKCTPYRQVGSTGPEGLTGEVIYIPPEKLGYHDCRDKIVLCEQKTSGDWMGLRNGFLLRLQNMGIKGLIVIEQDDYKPDVVHQRADFSVSGSPTPDNIDQIQTIPAIVHLNNNVGTEFRELVKQGGVKVNLTSVVDTGWKSLPLLATEIIGKVEPEKFLLVNCHVDTPPFSPGVTDNISGNIAVLELARILNQKKDELRRSVRFVIWTGHETGRYAGSTWYNDAFWHELRHNCICSYNIDSPGAAGATQFRNLQFTEVLDAAQDSVETVTGEKVTNFRWATRAGDGSFWGTGMPHVSITSSRPPDQYDPHVNYSGGGWWWHTPYATMEYGDIDILEMDVKVELNFIMRLLNCPVLPYNFTKYAERLHEIIFDLQEKSDNVKEYFNLNPVINQIIEFLSLSKRLEDILNEKSNQISDKKIFQLNKKLLWISRNINPVVHSNAGPSEQMSMETFGATPFPRIYDILALAKIPDRKSHEFMLLKNKLLRQRNIVEEGFYQANQLLTEAIGSIE